MAVHTSFFGDDAAEEDEAKEVGDGHEAVGRVGEVPDGGELLCGTNVNKRHPKHPVRQHATAAKEILDGFFPIITPADDGGENEGDECDEQDDGAEGVEISKGSAGELSVG